MNPEPYILANGRIVTAAAGSVPSNPLHGLSIVVSGGRIESIAEAESVARQFPHYDRIDLENRLLTPGLIDCHTHLVHGGNRAQEFESRLAGASYEDIARRGGGILSTVTQTRACSEDELVSSALLRLERLLAEGVTTVEIKSGYGLDLSSEQKMLRAARRLGKMRDISIVTSYLGAHAVPPEYRGHRTDYIDKLCNKWLPAIAAEGLACAVDAFCEDIAFTPQEVDLIFKTAAALGLRCKLHADQRSDLGGAALAARHHALSADHLEYSSEESIAAMAKSETVAVLLPGAFYFLNERQKPPVNLLRRYKVPIAVATDCNPGTSPLTSLLMAMNMAATLFGLTISECLSGVTRIAAQALGMDGNTGSLEVGKYGDIAIWNVETPAELVYRMGYNPLYARIWRGKWQTL